MKLKNGSVLGSDFVFRQTDLCFEDGKIIENQTDGEVFDASGMFVIPGFIDTHIHGAAGFRFSDENPDIDAISMYEASQGVTAIVATTASSDISSLIKQLSAIKKAAEAGTKGARIEGIHAEGPFLNKKYKGAMNEENIIVPDEEICEKLIKVAGGYLKIITVAPETEKVSEAIKFFVSRGVVVSMGHTNATYDEAQAAVELGASQATHTFNAMRALAHREPGVVGVTLTNDNVKCEMICDFVHLHPAVVKLIYNAKGAGHINIISDTGHAAGAGLTEFMVDGVMRYVKDGVVRLADGTIAGSAISLLGGVKNLYSLGIPLEEISRMASLNPARTLGIENRTGSLEVGKEADIVVLDKNFDVVMTIVKGKVVYKR